MTGRLEGKVAIVTGASSGIGRAALERFAAEGARVVAVSRSKDRLEEAREAVNAAGGECAIAPGDLSTQETADAVVQTAVDAFGGVDVLVNNAGVYEFRPLGDITEEHFHKLFDLNVLGLLLASREAVRHFGIEGGSIVNISSIASTLSPADASVYSGTKAAVDAVTRSLAKELGPRNIRVNAVNPGMVETEGVHAAGLDQSDFRKQVEAKTPLGRIGQPRDVAPTVVFLASEDSGWMTGESLVIAGGLR